MPFGFRPLAVAARFGLPFALFHAVCATCGMARGIGATAAGVGG